MESKHFRTFLKTFHYSDEDTEDSQKVIKSKNPRRRKRDFFNSIRSQMEFYFGNSNLCKDRFLMQLIKEDPYVPLDVFLNFNKMKKLVKSTQEIAKALEHSELLKLNENKTKVCRITEIPDNWNADDRTIYVECLPRNTNHEWIKNVFNRFGNISYISLPRFKISRKIKEFAFVEFEKIEFAEKALKAFKTQGNVISIDDFEPEKLMSISSYIKEQNEDKTEYSDGNPLKRLHSSDSEIDDKSSSSDHELEVKRSKLSPVKNLLNEFGSEFENISTGSSIPDDSGSDIIKKKKKHRRHKKKSLKKIESKKPDTCELKILSKIDWKRLRNRYLNMQRKKMGEIKREMKKKKFNRSNRAFLRDKINRTTTCGIKKPQSMNFYGAGQYNDDSHEHNKNEIIRRVESTNPALERIPLFKYEPKLIVKIKLLESCVDVKGLKADIKQYPGIKYVDVKEGSIDAYVRCETPKHARNLKKRISCAEYICDILSGEQEIEYWNKIMRDREMKLNREVKVSQKRGREKAAKKLVTHIFFSSDD